MFRKRNGDCPVDSDPKSTELLWDDEGLTTAINITMNPLLRFRPDSSSSDGNLSDEQARQSFEECSEASLYWSESDDEAETEARNELEWDSSYHDDFGEDCSEGTGENGDSRKVGSEVKENVKSNDDIFVACPNRADVLESRL